MAQVFETDWLASRPVFYNERTGKVSYNINDVIDYANLEFDPEGVNNYLDFGYAALGQTPVKHVKFLRHSSRLIVHDDGKLGIEYLPDPVDQWIGKTSHEDDVFDLLFARVREWEKSVEGEIVIPTSGGYDSRLLNLLVEDKSRIRSFTYGISRNQSDSYEVVYAKKVSEILGTRWEQIPLGDFHLYLDDWDALFGVSTHAHGMYHAEFYTKIKPRVQGGNPLLNGIIGDAWSGNVKIPEIKCHLDLPLLGYTHGLHADSRYSRFQINRPLLEKYFNAHKDKLRIPLFCIVEAMRYKLILLSYLMIVPESLGFKPWGPFLCLEIALSMATLPPERRRNRLWQQEFFRKHGLDVENIGLTVDKTNESDLFALYHRPVLPLDVQLLREVVEPSYVEWVNRTLGHLTVQSLIRKLLAVRKVGGILRRLKIKDEVMSAYQVYMVLKPIENLLKKRERQF